MKQTMIRLLAILSLLAVLCMGLVSCGASDPIDAYWQYLQDKDDTSEYIITSQVAVIASQAVTQEETDERMIAWMVYTQENSSVYSLTMEMSEVSDRYEYVYQTMVGSSSVVEATGYVDVATFTGEEVLSFDQYSGNTVSEHRDRAAATGLMVMLVNGMNTLLDRADMSVESFGFNAALFDGETAEGDSDASEDLGGAFSKERLIYAGEMILLGMGMVFLVLAILWAVLGIFKLCLYHPEGEQEKTSETPAPTPAVTQAAPVAANPAPTAMDDGALLAVITAAVAAAMAEEGTGSTGFRVVSFKKTTNGGPWNQ